MATSNSNLEQDFELSSFKSHGQPCTLSLRLPALDIKFLWTINTHTSAQGDLTLRWSMIRNPAVTLNNRVDRRPAF